ncbi:MAG TPA: DUF5054 domain-containing protein [Herpetosiphonaceae bacterium]|nr:DUF5054 domain-containing protein [Herpetosiphonaceae bacterium]
MIWTTGSWLIYQQIEEASEDQRHRMEEAIAAGDITWHALPFTTHTELLDPSLFNFALSLSADLDRRFGKQTIAGKMTDVPGHTRGIVPLLAAAGIQFLHIGVNPASHTPDVPPVFVWRNLTGAEVVVMYHHGSYDDLMIVPGLSDAIYFAHTDDNQGPQTPQQVLETFQKLRALLPGARVIASTLDAFARKIHALKPRLPVVQAEIGDTWIHGVGSDPLKTSRFRELQRLRGAWLASGQVRADDKRIAEFSRHLLMVPEHTWGLDEKVFLGDEQAYAAAIFRSVRPTGGFRLMEESWIEQRAYIDTTVAALGDTPQATEARSALAALSATEPHMSGFARVDAAAACVETRHFRIGFEPDTGAIAQLESKISGRVWSDADHPLALFGYQVFGQAEYDRFLDQYLINKQETAHWSLPDFGKPGLRAVLPMGRQWSPSLVTLQHRSDETGHRFVAHLKLAEEASEQFGAPRRIVLECFLPDDSPILHLTLQWFAKPACRIPEAMWLSFIPAIRDEYGWRLDKLGEAIEPHDVVPNGNRKLHAVDRGIVFQDATGRLEIETLDAVLVAPGEPSLLDFNTEQPAITRGMHFNLFNNVWGTNFRMWYDDDTRFRFSLKPV